MAKNNRVTKLRDHPLRTIENHLRRKTDRQGPQRSQPLDEKLGQHRAGGFDKTPSTTVVATTLVSTANITQSGFIHQENTITWGFVPAGGKEGSDCIQIDDSDQGLHKTNLANMAVHDKGQFSVWVKGFNSGVSHKAAEYTLSIHQMSDDATPEDEESLVIVWDFSEEELRLYPDITNFPLIYVAIPLLEAEWQEEFWHQIRATWSYSDQRWRLWWDDTEGEINDSVTLIPWPSWDEFTKMEVFTRMDGQRNIYHNCQFLSLGQTSALITHDELADMPSGDNTDHDERYADRAEWNQNGISDIDLSTLTWTDAGPIRTISIQPTAADFDFYQAGVVYTSTGDTLQIADTDGLWAFYYDAGVLTSLHDPSHIQIEELIEDKCFVGYVYWNVALAEGKLFEERHGKSMSPTTHRYLHETVGMAWGGLGLALADILADDTGADNEDAQFSNTEGEVYDEDIGIIISAVGKLVGLEIWYLDTGVWFWDTNAGFSVIKTGVGGEDRLAYNDGVTPLVEVGNAKFVLCHVFATTLASLELIAIVGQDEYLTKAAAQDAAETEISTLMLDGLPTPEMMPVATVIFQTSDAYGNAIKARIISTNSGADYMDWRGQTLTGAGATSAVLPGGANGDVQYKKGSLFAGEAAFNYDDTTGVLTVGDVETPGTAAIGTAAINPNIGANIEQTYVDTDNTQKIGAKVDLVVSKTTADMTARAAGFDASLTLDATNDQNWTNSVNGIRSTIVTENGATGILAAVNGLQVDANIDGVTVGELRGVHIKEAVVAGFKAAINFGIKIEDVSAGALNFGLSIGDVSSGSPPFFFPGFAIQTTATGLVLFGDHVTCGKTLGVGGDINAASDVNVTGQVSGGITYCVHYDSPPSASGQEFFGLKLLQNETTLPVGFGTRLDFPRTIAVTVFGDGTTDADVTVNGIDANGAVISEVINFVDIGLVILATNLAFAQVTSIVVTNTGGGAGQYAAGWTDVLGLPDYPFNVTTDLFKITSNGAYVDPTALTIVAAYGTVDMTPHVNETQTYWYRPYM